MIEIKLKHNNGWSLSLSFGLNGERYLFLISAVEAEIKKNRLSQSEKLENLYKVCNNYNEALYATYVFSGLYQR